MSSFNLLGLGTQALRANQTALATVGQNISNVNTPGYSRQIASFTTLQDSNGVKIDDIDRITDQFLTQQLWSDLASYNQTSTYSDLSSELDNLLATESSSVSSALDSYFSALQNVVDDPVSIPNRELFVAQSDALVQRFNNLDASIQRQNDMVNGTLSNLSSQVNSLSQNIAELNQDIKLQVAANKPANELRDQRDELTNQLSSLIGITVLEQGPDNFSIFVANGEPLVMGITANRLETMPGDPDISQNSLVLRIANSTADVTNLLSGGKIGGLLEYRENALNAARDELGRIAIGFTESMNAAHRAGIDLNNKLGGDLFSDVNTSSLQSERISAAFDNQSVVSTARVEIQDATQLQASDYELFYASANEITLTRNSDGQQIKINQLSDAVADRTVSANPLNWGGNIAPSLTPVTSETITATLNGVAAVPGIAVDSAQSMAGMLNGLAGVSGVVAETAINISGVADGGTDGVTFDLTVNDATGNARTVTINLAAGGLSDGSVASAINAALSDDSNDFSHLAISTVVGGGIKVVDSTGGNIAVKNTGTAADSISIQNYSSNGSLLPGGPVAVSPADTGTVVGYLKEAEATVDSSVTSLSLSAGTLVGATTVLVDGTNNVESTRGDTTLGAQDVDDGEFYLDPLGKNLTFAIDGIKVSIATSTNLSKGDRFLIQPVRQGAENITLELKDGRQLALASPVRVTADSDNKGSGVASVTVTNPNDLKASRSNELEPPISIVFNAPDVSVDPDAPVTYTIYDMTEPSNPKALESNVYTEGEPIALNGYNVTIDNQPEPGDRFSFTFNKEGISDNRNALALSDLQKASTLDGGSYQDLYGSLVEKVGTRTATSRITVQANKAVLDSTVNAKASIAGVNLDEEAAKLVQFQQAYQASAQLIKASQTLFDTLLNSI
jgi:flagellar hook-associated protein FlgK